ncbi:MAG: triosephosphate isomerase, triosephosphate isomerase [Candidatus Kaiserbacteria bacterium]|nr:triosephosphate isomerase, triosephosphate isomerase [Candidatus Kaiserbacteria bacterium]
MKSIVVANWKMNPVSMKEAKKLFDATKKAADGAKNVTVIVAPPALFLRELRGAYKGKKLSFALQNAHFEQSGAYTGENSLTQADDAKIEYVIVGHAERRAAGETNEDTGKKVSAALALKMTPILCVGEATRSHNGEHFDFVREQLATALAQVPPAKLGKLLIAYEPVWAIGASTPMAPRDMHEMGIFIRKAIVDQHGQAGMNIRILYGGSIDATNAVEMLHEGDVMGFVLGRASYDAQKFSLLMKVLSDA